MFKVRFLTVECRVHVSVRRFHGGGGGRRDIFLEGCKSAVITKPPGRFGVSTANSRSLPENPGRAREGQSPYTSIQNPDNFFRRFSNVVSVLLKPLAFSPARTRRRRSPCSRRRRRRLLLPRRRPCITHIRVYKVVADEVGTAFRYRYPTRNNPAGRSSVEERARYSPPPHRTSPRSRHVPGGQSYVGERRLARRPPFRTGTYLNRITPLRRYYRLPSTDPLSAQSFRLDNDGCFARRGVRCRGRTEAACSTRADWPEWTWTGTGTTWRSCSETVVDDRKSGTRRRRSGGWSPRTRRRSGTPKTSALNPGEGGG